jgi:hypothetical protein
MSTSRTAQAKIDNRIELFSGKYSKTSGAALQSISRNLSGNALIAPVGELMNTLIPTSPACGQAPVS